MSDRMKQIDELIKQSLSIIIQKFSFESIVSVTQVNVSKDLSYAKVWVASVDDMEAVVKECQNNAKLFQKEMARTLILRKIPKLHFVTDTTSLKVDRIEKLISQIKNDK